MNLGLGINIGGRAAGGFSPALLFAASEPGVWYDPSDFSTMFQNSDGTTPVTAAGQSVGFLGDKSRGFVLGSNLFPNDGVISNTTGWVAANGGTISAVGGGLRIVGNGVTAAPKATYTLTVTNGAWVRIRMSWSGNSGGTTIFLNGGSTEGTITSSTAASGTFDAVVKATNTTMLVVPVALSATSDITYSGFSVRELPGNHATQSTAASRPTLGRVPVGGRRNLLTFTEQFDNAAWQLNAATKTSTVVPDPNGGSSAYQVSFTASATSFIFFQALSAPPATVTLSVWVRSVSGTKQFRLRYNDQLSNQFSSDFTASTTWQRVSVSFTSTPGGTSYQFSVCNGSSAVAGDILIWGAQLETGSTATAYQRVVTAFDVTQAGVADCYYLSFDGSDDFLVTGTITPGTDKAQVFAGVRKLSDAAQGMLVETSTSAAANAGAFVMRAPTAAAANYGWFTWGTGGAGTSSATSSAIYAAPITNVLTGIGDIAADTSILRVNGTEAASSTADQGTGNYLAYPLYIGRRGGTTLPFNGQLFGLVTRFGANLTADQITQAERFVAGKTGVVI